MLFTGSGAYIVPENRTSTADVFQVEFPGSSENAAISGESLLPWKSNFFIGNDPGKWRTNVANYSTLRYKELYDGVDLVYYGDNGSSEIRFHHQTLRRPGNNTCQIQTGKYNRDDVDQR